MLARSRGVVQTTASSGALSPTSSMASMLRGGGRLRFRSHLGGFRDLPCDLHDVLVRVETVELPVGAVAAAEDLLDARQLLLRAEVAGVRLQRLQRPAHQR